MTSPMRAYTDADGARRYIGKNKTLRPKSVTSFLGMLPKPWLAPWIAKIVSQNAAEVLMDIRDNDSWGEQPRPGIIDNYTDDDIFEVDYELLAKDLAESWEWERDGAGALGDEVHSLCEEILTKSLGDYKLASMYFEAAEWTGWSENALYRGRQLLGFLEQHTVRIIEIEPTIYNDTYLYAGSADFIAYIDGVLCLVDIKTSRTWSDSFAPQVSAYSRGEYYMTDHSEETHPMPAIERGAVLWIEPDRCRLIEIDISDDTFDVFLACITLANKWSGIPSANKTTVYDSKGH